MRNIKQSLARTTITERTHLGKLVGFPPMFKHDIYMNTRTTTHEACARETPAHAHNTHLQTHINNSPNPQCHSLLPDQSASQPHMLAPVHAHTYTQANTLIPNDFVITAAVTAGLYSIAHHTMDSWRFHNTVSILDWRLRGQWFNLWCREARFINLISSRRRKIWLQNMWIAIREDHNHLRPAMALNIADPIPLDTANFKSSSLTTEEVRALVWGQFSFS